MGSALGAARTLGVNQTTVVRRIAHMEEVLGGVLFERKQSGLQLTPFGQRVATAAARVENKILAVEPDLQRCLPPIAELDSQTWLVLREDLKHSSHDVVGFGG